MIRIDFPETSGSSASLKVSGHANADGKGNDVVCAAVSALVQTLAGGVEETMQGHVYGDFESGNCNITLKVPENRASSLNSICKIFRFGFRKISEIHPEQVELI